jgi:hypothetical protein
MLRSSRPHLELLLSSESEIVMRKLSVQVSFIKKICILSMSLAWALGAVAQDFHDGQASISGRVLDVSRNPYPAKIQIFQLVIQEGFATPYLRCDTSAGQEGGFECSKLPAGKYIVQVLPLSRSAKRTQEAQDAVLETTPKLIFYPGVTDLEEATPISLQRDEAGWAEVRVADSPAVEVTGMFSEHASTAFLGLKAESKDGLILDTGIVPIYDSKTGRFVISNVPAGHYQLAASWFVGRETRRAKLPFVVDAKSVKLLLSATSDVEIKGQLRTFPSGVTISQILLVSTDGSVRDRNTQVKGGAFNFRSVPAGEYVLSLPPSQQVYVDAVSVGRESLNGSRFTVSPGQGIVNLELELRAGHTVRGSVNEWKGSAVSAEVIAQSEDSGQIYKTTTDKQRNFSFAGVKPGEYRLFAWPGANTIEYRNPLVLRKYKDDSTEVWVDQDGIISAIELSPIETER